MDRPPLLHGHFDFIGVATLHLFGACQFNAGTLGCIIHQRAIELSLRGRNLQFILRKLFDYAPIQIWPQFPAVGAIVNLKRRLPCELELETHFARPREFNEEWQINFL
jgi:hypothetical protein